MPLLRSILKMCCSRLLPLQSDELVPELESCMDGPLIYFSGKICSFELLRTVSHYCFCFVNINSNFLQWCIICKTEADLCMIIELNLLDRKSVV